MTSRSALLGRLAAMVAKSEPAQPLTWRLCHATRELLSADGASITLENSTPYRVTLCATDDRSTELENLQDVLEEGPCRDAFDHGRTVQTLIDREAAVRWPRFIPAAAEVVGSAGVLWSVPMHAGADVIGAVSMYTLERPGLAEAMDVVQFLADTVAVSVTHDPLSFNTSGDALDWGSRSKVHQATGMVVALLAVSPDDALALLRAYAFSQGRSLNEVAEGVVGRRLDITDA
jgi:GAF domain-containing protein/ANTAR domain-containing protein